MTPPADAHAWLALTLVLATLAALGATSAPTMGPAPGFELATTGAENGGEPGTMRLADHRGRVVLLDFMAVGCLPCRDVTDDVVKPLLDKHPGLVVLSIDAWSDPTFQAAGETDEALRVLQQREGTAWPHARDTAGVHVAYGVTGLPRVVVVDREGHIVLARDGVPDLAVVDRAIERA